MRMFIATIMSAVIAMLCSCSGWTPATPTKQTEQRELAELDAVLSAKIRCADEGRRYFDKDYVESKSLMPKTTANAKFSYNQKMNTCLCEEMFMNKSDESKYITDVLTNQYIAGYSAVPTDRRQRTTDDSDRVAAFDKTERELFPESNVSAPERAK